MTDASITVCLLTHFHIIMNFILQIILNMCQHEGIYLPGHQDKLGVAETKLLHTLHWMLLEAPHECNHESSLGHGWSGGSSSSAFLQPVGNQGLSPGGPGSGSALGGSGPQHSSSLLEQDEQTRTKLFQKSMSTVELFVFLFAPLIHRIKVCSTKVDHTETFRLSGRS